MAVDDKVVDSVAGLKLELDDYAIGDRVTLTVVRNGRSMRIETLLERES